MLVSQLEAYLVSYIFARGLLWGFVQGRRGRRQGAMAPPIFSKLSDFRKIYCFIGNFRTFAVSKNKCFEFYHKIFELAPLLYRCHNASGLVREDLKVLSGSWLYSS